MNDRARSDHRLRNGLAILCHCANGYTVFHLRAFRYSQARLCKLDEADLQIQFSRVRVATNVSPVLDLRLMVLNNRRRIELSTTVDSYFPMYYTMRAIRRKTVERLRGFVIPCHRINCFSSVAR